MGELNGSAQARWLKTIEVFNEQGETEQLKVFPSQIEAAPVTSTSSPRNGIAERIEDGGNVRFDFLAVLPDV